MKILWSQCPSASCNEFTSTLNNRDNERVEQTVGDGGERESVKEEGKCLKEKGTGEKETGKTALHPDWLEAWSKDRHAEQNVIIDVRHHFQPAALSSSLFLNDSRGSLYSIHNWKTLSSLLGHETQTARQTQGFCFLNVQRSALSSLIVFYFCHCVNFQII